MTAHGVTFSQEFATELLESIAARDRHISRKELERKYAAGEIVAIKCHEGFCGWLRWNLFWDNTPFLNMLFILDGHRNQGIGKEALLFWEMMMVGSGYDIVMTSTQAQGEAQHFYRKCGYEEIGSFIVPGEDRELIFIKNIVR